MSAAPSLSLDVYAGPLDLLLDLARAQRVDLQAISIVTLADQFVAAVEAGDGVALRQRSDWVVMAAWLVLLKSRLLLPAEAGEAAQRDAEQLRDDLALRAHLATAVAWLDARPRLGRDVFTRLTGATRTPTRGGDPVALFEACLVALRAMSRASSQPLLLPPPPPFTAADARTRMREMLRVLPPGSPLASFLPPLEKRHNIRASLAALLVAGLELTREGEVHIDQQTAFGPITVRNVATAKE